GTWALLPTTLTRCWRPTTRRLHVCSALPAAWVANWVFPRIGVIRSSNRWVTTARYLPAPWVKILRWACRVASMPCGPMAAFNTPCRFAKRQQQEGHAALLFFSRHSNRLTGWTANDD